MGANETSKVNEAAGGIVASRMLVAKCIGATAATSASTVPELVRRNRWVRRVPTTVFAKSIAVRAQTKLMWYLQGQLLIGTTIETLIRPMQKKNYLPASQPRWPRRTRR